MNYPGGAFRAERLEGIEPRLGERHWGRLRHEGVAAKPGRAIAQELERLRRA
ncbi:MAG: hypothetical protein ABSH34_33345 [Verrucomicrobiota bacterium]